MRVEVRAFVGVCVCVCVCAKIAYIYVHGYVCVVGSKRLLMKLWEDIRRKVRFIYRK